MELRSISLKGFRNIAEAEISFDSGVNLVYGDNAQGKTSLLEAIHLLSAGRSFRTHHLKECVGYDADFARVEAQFQTQRDEHARLKMTLTKAGQREVFRCGVKATKLSEIIGYLTVVLFVPEHLSMVKDGPGVRRSFIDSAISQLYPMYPSYLNQYKKLYEVRCNLIRKAREGGSRELFGLYHEPLSQVSAKIALMRRAYIEKLIPKSNLQYALISDSREELSLQYESDIPSDLTKEEEIASFLAERLERDVETDIRCGFPLRGIHRDDLVATLDSKSARSYASQGQQRSIVLALKLSEGEIAADETGEVPVFLFDDVLSELDRKRRDYVLSKLDGKQTILTFCESVRRKHLADARRITVKGGVFS